MFTDPEYHRRRAEIEMQQALEAGHPSTAVLHLALAKMHREKRESLALELRARALECPPSIDRTDKEC
jgi:hypothetical protein